MERWPKMSTKKRQKNIIAYNFKELSSKQKILLYTLLSIGVFYAIFPVIWLLSTSFKLKEDIFSKNIQFIPPRFTFDNYIQVLTENDFIYLQWFFNSVLVATLTTLLSVFLAMTAAYAFSRFRFWGRKTGLLLFLIVQMFPAVTLIVPLYRILNSMHLLNTYLSLILAYSTIVIPFSIFILKRFFDTIPKELEAAARIDGLSRIGAFYKIVLPLSLPALAVTGFYGFITSWNEFMYALTFINAQDKLLLPIGIQKYVTIHNAQWHLLSASAVIMTIPVMIFFFSVQKTLLSGRLTGAVKG